MAHDWPEQLTEAGIGPDYVDMGALAALWLADVQPWLEHSAHGQNLTAAMRAAFAAGIAFGRDELRCPPPYPGVETPA